MPVNPGLQVARPNINIAGQDQPRLVEGLLGLAIVESTSGLYRCEALFGNWGPKNGNIGFLYFDRQTLDFGKALKIKLDTDVIFDGRIMGLEAQFPEGRPPALNVLAEDRFQDLRMTRRTRSFENINDSSLFNQIASDHGLSPSVSVSGPTHRVLTQVNQSDLAFMRERARSIDAELWMDGSTLNCKSRANRGSSTMQMTLGNQLREFSVLADLANQRTTVTVSGWDVSAKNGIKYDATDSVISGELDGGTSGASLLRSAIGDRKESLSHTVPFIAGEAQAEAEAVFKMTARRFLVGRGVAEMSARLRVGVKVDLAGLGPLFSGKYYVSEVKHVFDLARGFRTEFTAERPGLGRP
jgi:hypothetical protein